VRTTTRARVGGRAEANTNRNCPFFLQSRALPFLRCNCAGPIPSCKGALQLGSKRYGYIQVAQVSEASFDYEVRRFDDWKLESRIA